MNTLLYIGITLLGIPLKVLSAILYPIVFLFRHKVLSYMSDRIKEDEVNRVFVVRPWYGRKKWELYLHPYFWMFCFTTGLTDQWSGPDWFMRDKKSDWLFDLIDAKVLNCNDLLFNITYYLRYFYICYRWQGLRNSNWAFSEWFFREGKWKDDTVSIKYCYPAEGSIYKYWDIMPQLKWDEGNDGGKLLRWQTDETPVDDIWLRTHLGKKKLTFITHKGNKRFMYCYAKIVYLRRLKLKLIIEHQFGWNYWNGMVILHFKHILRKN